MLIDRKTPAVAALLTEWETAPRTQESAAQFKMALAKSIIEPAIHPFAGQLILFYHKFLTMRPTGSHSFAHGLEMCSQDVHWLTAGRLADKNTLSFFASWIYGTRVAQPPEKKPVIITSPSGSRSYHIPLRWFWHTQTHFRRGAYHPHFVMHTNGPVYEPGEQDDVGAPALDISAFGNHLFRLQEGRHDWATNISIIVGTRSVRKWLAENKSSATFNRIARL